jgi:hypothetical protein
MNRTTIMAVVMAVCLLAVPIAAGAVAAQTADEPTNETETNETVDSDDTPDDDASDDDGSEDADDDSDDADDEDAEEDDSDADNEIDDADNGTDDADENETDAEFAYDATLDNGTVTVAVTEDDSLVANATVAVNETVVGTTDENGTVAFDLGNRSAVELSVSVDSVTQTTVYAVDDGSLVAQDDEGPPTAMPEPVPDQVSMIHELISAFQNGEYDKLGPIVSSAAGNGNAPEQPGNSSGNAPDKPGNAGNAPPQAGNAGNAPGQADRGAENAPGNSGTGNIGNGGGVR